MNNSLTSNTQPSSPLTATEVHRADTGLSQQAKNCLKLYATSLKLSPRAGVRAQQIPAAQVA